jgi:hypothetical protein
MGILSYGYKASKTPVGKKVVETVKDFFKSRGKNPTPGTINTVPIAKNLKKRFDTKQAGFKSVDDQTKGTNVDISKKSKIKKEFSKAVSNAYDKFEGATKKAKGGRVGLKGGSNLGMQSVKYGLDNKPEITKLDRIAKFIAKDKNKKKIAKKFKTPMEKAIKKNKKKII